MSVVPRRNLLAAVRGFALMGCALLPIAGCEEPAEEGESAQMSMCFSNGQPEITLGDASSDFVPLRDGVEPVLLYGIQGGQHVVVAIRIDGIDLEPQGFSVELLAEDSQSCAHADDCTWEIVGRSEFEVDGYDTLEPGLVGIDPYVLVLVRWLPERHRRIRALVTDLCGNTEEVSIEFPSAS